MDHTFVLGARGSREKASDLLEPEFQVLVSHPVWVWGNDPGFSQERKCSDRWVISAALTTLKT